MYLAMGQMTLPPRAAAAEFFPMTPEAGGRLAARGRPTPLVEVRPQERVQRHTMKHVVDVSPCVQILDVPVPQMGGPAGGIRAASRHCDPRAGYRSAQDLSGPTPQRFVDGVVRRRRSGWWKCRLSSPVPLCSCLRSRTGTFQFLALVVIVEFFSGFLPGQGSLQRTVDQIVGIPGGCLQDFLPDPGSSASSAVLRDEAIQRVFRTFPRVQKSAQSARRWSAGVAAHSSSWTPAAHEPGESLSEEEDPDRWIDEHGRTWWRSCAVLGRWYVLGTGRDVDIFWDEPGKGSLGSWGATCGCFFLVS